MSANENTPARASFRFLTDREKVAYLDGTVLFRDGRMVLDVRGGGGPYVIDGRPCQTWFAGENLRRDGWNPVRATWALVGDLYVGSWVEDDTKYLFSFELTPS